MEEIPAGLVFQAIGYRGVPLPGVPFNHRWGTINNRAGRVIHSDGTILPGLFTVGWVKRGPSGVIGTNKPDAVETVKEMLLDLQAGISLQPTSPDAESARDMVRAKQPRHVFFKDWLRLDQIEVTRGEAQNRPRVKFSAVEEMLSHMDI